MFLVLFMLHVRLNRKQFRQHETNFSFFTVQLYCFLLFKNDSDFQSAERLMAEDKSEKGSKLSTNLI